MYQVILTKKVGKYIRNINKKLKKRILKILSGLKNNPFIGKKLDGDFKNNYSIRIGNYRIIYEIKKKKLIVYIIQIGDRKDVYK